jgi:hypothetical protein
MMIRLREGAHTSTVLLIRVSWDPIRKRSAQKVLGSFSAYVGSLPDELGGPDSPLTDAEKAEARDWIAARLARQQASTLPSTGRRITRYAVELADAIDDPATAQAALSELDHLALYEAMDRLAKTLRRHGLPRPPRRKAEPESTVTVEAPESLTSS